MTLIATQQGLYFPYSQWGRFPTSGQSGVLDAATEKYAMIGRLYIDGRPAGAKTLSTGSIQYRTAGVTFANGSTLVDIGIQDVAAGSGPIAQPDGTFDVKTTLTGGGGGITANAWNTATMNSGSKSMSHGDLIAAVWDMTARGGADSVTVAASQTPARAALGSTQLPTTNAFVSGAWQTTAAQAAGFSPNLIIVFDDGTLGWIEGGQPFSAASTETFQDSTNPDERGLMFQVPWNSKADALWALAGQTDANSDFTIKLWQDPTGSPVSLASFAVSAENLGVVNSAGLIEIPLTSEIALLAGINYAVAILATGTSNTILRMFTVGNAAHRVTVPGGTTLAKVTRNGGSGAFAAESPAVTIYGMGVRISRFPQETPPVIINSRSLVQ